ncbi:MAG: hypothetical protein AAF652_20340 [Cyanobacteria bacterium P01_C01_bin.72]
MSFLDDIEDLDAFTAGEFANPAVLTRIKSSGEPLVLSGIFDENYQDMFGGFDSQTAEGRKFCFRVQTSQTIDLRHGDRLTINSNNYLINSHQLKSCLRIILDNLPSCSG